MGVGNLFQTAPHIVTHILQAPNAGLLLYARLSSLHGIPLPLLTYPANQLTREIPSLVLATTNEPKREKKKATTLTKHPEGTKVLVCQIFGGLSVGLGRVDICVAINLFFLKSRHLPITVPPPVRMPFAPGGAGSVHALVLIVITHPRLCTAGTPQLRTLRQPPRCEHILY